MTNRVADALSRRNHLLTTMKVEVTGFELLPELFEEDPYFAKFVDEVKEGKTDDM